ncbi:uncharacterized protein B0I36DRAFT_327577 [Microdochium trichocladiopsis]|uniref:Uncharacterized protein n=1 Tax=Microdochium trichocladiopsis TaxID=1682393 RepID=A0A9P8Y0M7_9PEZI|nr:uncharacterized protein B0I36DRAFT_327577 [Microdochium trichocladiopsis]KAH7027658.1 hypothetical protein B0I36DRAFT_327577 [Microdochium trichocladiopsis]
MMEPRRNQSSTLPCHATLCVHYHPSPIACSITGAGFTPHGKQSRRVRSLTKKTVAIRIWQPWSWVMCACTSRSGPAQRRHPGTSEAVDSWQTSQVRLPDARALQVPAGRSHVKITFTDVKESPRPGLGGWNPAQHSQHRPKKAQRVRIFLEKQARLPNQGAL